MRGGRRGTADIDRGKRRRTAGYCEGKEERGSWFTSLTRINGSLILVSQ